MGEEHVEPPDTYQFLHEAREQVLSRYPDVTGFNVGVNSGHSAGQTVEHAHLHLIPRRDGDVANPGGGVRGVIPEKQKY